MRTTAIDLTIRATRSVELYHYRRAVLRPRQIAYLPLMETSKHCCGEDVVIAISTICC